MKKLLFLLLAGAIFSDISFSSQLNATKCLIKIPDKMFPGTYIYCYVKCADIPKIAKQLLKNKGKELKK